MIPPFMGPHQDGQNTIGYKWGLIGTANKEVIK